MKHSYKKMYNKNYLVLDEFDEPLSTQDYKLEMLRRNTIEGLLSMQISIEDNMPLFYYDITSKQSFYSYFYDNKLTKNHIINFFNDLRNTLHNLNKFLLDYDHLVILPQCIFFDKSPSLDSPLDREAYANNYSFSFCYCPSYTSDFFSSLKEFISYLLTITDHDDEKTVLVSYALWQETQNENFNLKSLIAVIDKYSENIKIPSQPPIQADITTEKENNILKEPDVLLKENYTYTPAFMIKNIAVFSIAIIILLINIFMKILSVYSMELFFIIMIAIIIFCIFYASGIVHEAPLHRVYDKYEEPIPKDILRINTDIQVHDNTENKNDVSDSSLKHIENDSSETVLLCVNPRLQNRRLIYNGIDFSHETELEKYPFSIGKKDTNNLIINNPAISRCHARIFFDNGTYYIEDLNSSNGTKINENSIPAYTLTEINIGDTITFADLTYIFQ